MVEQNVHPKRLQERLGHSSIRMTLDTYGHLMKGLETEGSDLDELLSAPAVARTWHARGSVTRLRKA